MLIDIIRQLLRCEEYAMLKICLLMFLQISLVKYIYTIYMMFEYIKCSLLERKCVKWEMIIIGNTTHPLSVSLIILYKDYGILNEMKKEEQSIRYFVSLE